MYRKNVSLITTKFNLASSYSFKQFGYKVLANSNEQQNLRTYSATAVYLCIDVTFMSSLERNGCDVP